MTKPTCPVCDGEMIWDISADAARYICLWSEKQPEMHAQLAAAVAEHDELRLAIQATMSEQTELRRVLREIVSDAMAGVGYDDGTCIYCVEPIHDNGAGHAGKCPIYRGRAFMDIPIPKREEDDDE